MDEDEEEKEPSYQEASNRSDRLQLKLATGIAKQKQIKAAMFCLFSESDNQLSFDSRRRDMTPSSGISRRLRLFIYIFLGSIATAGTEALSFQLIAKERSPPPVQEALELDVLCCKKTSET